MSAYEQSTVAQPGFNKRTEGALEPAGTDLLAGDATHGQQQRSGMNEVCDPPTIYNAPGAREAVNYVHDSTRERTYEPLDVNKTVVQHEIERVKPVLHQEEHRTVLHEVVHHKVDAPRDLGITQVVHHGHTDPCGNPISGIPGATIDGLNTAGVTTGAYSSDATRGLAGTDRPLATGSVSSTSSDSSSDLESERGTTGLTGTTATTPYTGTAATTTPATTTPYQSTEQTGAYGQTEHTQEPGGIKGLINKVVPGPGPFKPK